MQFRPLGRTGLNLSSLSFGASSLGQEFRQVDLQEAIRSVRVALDLGMNVIHGSDSTARAGAEIALFFEDHEIHDYQRTVERWIRE